MNEQSNQRPRESTQQQNQRRNQLLKERSRHWTTESNWTLETFTGLCHSFRSWAEQVVNNFHLGGTYSKILFLQLLRENISKTPQQQASKSTIKPTCVCETRRKAIINQRCFQSFQQSFVWLVIWITIKFPYLQQVKSEIEFIYTTQGNHIGTERQTFIIARSWQRWELIANFYLRSTSDCCRRPASVITHPAQPYPLSLCKRHSSPPCCHIKQKVLSLCHSPHKMQSDPTSTWEPIKSIFIQPDVLLAWSKSYLIRRIAFLCLSESDQKWDNFYQTARSQDLRWSPNWPISDSESWVWLMKRVIQQRQRQVTVITSSVLWQCISWLIAGSS